MKARHVRERREGGGDVDLEPSFLIELEGLIRRFGDVAAVEDLSLAVHRGEFVSLLGPSGSGKTTTLMMIAGFEQPDAGTVRLGGRDVTGLPAHRRNIGMVFQDYALFPHMTVFDNVAYPLTLRKRSRSAVLEGVSKALEIVRLPVDVFGRRYPKQLSGGQQQRVGLARAISYEPSVLLMDEPMGALDKGLRAQLQLELRAIHERLGLTVLYVTHDQEEALILSDRIAVFRDGRIEQIDTPRSLYERPVNRFVARFLGDANLLDVTVEGSMLTLADGSPTPLRSTVTYASGEYKLMVRPEALSIVAEGNGLLRGVVRTVTYLGGLTRIDVDAGNTALAILVESRSVIGLGRGATVGVTFDAVDPVLLP